MRNQILGKGTFFAFGMAALLWVAPAGAQVSTMRMEIPFMFVAGDRVLPAGPYVVTVDENFHHCRLDSLAAPGISIVRLLPPVEDRAASKAGQGTLLFTRYGGQHFLSAVWRPGREAGSRVVTSKRLLEAAGIKDGGPATSVVIPN